MIGSEFDGRKHDEMINDEECWEFEAFLQGWEKIIKKLISDLLF